MASATFASISAPTSAVLKCETSARRSLNASTSFVARRLPSVKLQYPAASRRPNQINAMFSGGEDGKTEKKKFITQEEEPDDIGRHRLRGREKGQ
ncbi:hypothetical protein CLOP_g24431 [Closterium sp. NIES-67]|nr:hypothetical protein CLOP_g24431 [Closterium sp. NIES-67]